MTLVAMPQNLNAFRNTIVHMSPKALEREPDYIIPVSIDRIVEGYADIRSSLEVTQTIHKMELNAQHKLKAPILSQIQKNYKGLEETVDDVLYWDEQKNIIYMEALAVFKSTAEFLKFRVDFQTRLNLSHLECPICRNQTWKAKNIVAKTIADREGKPHKCLSIFFACEECLKENRISNTAIRFLGIKYALAKSGRGLKDFLDRIKSIKIQGDLNSQAATAEIELNDARIKLERCPLL